MADLEDHATAMAEITRLRSYNEGLARISAQQDAEIERLRVGLRHAIQAAKLALFVIHKQGVMPNSSWEGGFKDNLAAAESALSSGNGGER